MANHVKVTILVLFLIIVGSAFYVLYATKNQPQNALEFQNPKYAPPVADASSEPATVEASDGKWKLVIKEQKGKEDKTYVFSTVDESTNYTKELFTKTVSTDTTMSIPANTFSPDDKYVFLKEVSPTQTSYFVMLTSGAPIAKDTQNYEISSLYAQKYTDFKITDVTGWGGMALLVVNTDKAGGGVGPSFWFDVTSKSFIRLNDRFN